jgi:glycerol-3-phosphate cytidylyltransferase
VILNLESMRTILTYGTFDLLHIGHINLLRRAKALGDKLIVAVSTDEFNLTEKNKVCVNSYADRKVILESLRFVDLVIPEENWEQKNTDVEKHAVDVFTMGDDWTGHFDFLKDRCEVVYLPRTANISTTEIKQTIATGTRG